jgi:hypothetical protein
MIIANLLRVLIDDLSESLYLLWRLPWGSNCLQSAVNPNRMRLDIMCKLYIGETFRATSMLMVTLDWLVVMVAARSHSQKAFIVWGQWALFYYCLTSKAVVPWDRRGKLVRFQRFQASLRRGGYLHRMLLLRHFHIFQDLYYKFYLSLN